MWEIFMRDFIYLFYRFEEYLLFVRVILGVWNVLGNKGEKVK